MAWSSVVECFSNTCKARFHPWQHKEEQGNDPQHLPGSTVVLAHTQPPLPPFDLVGGVSVHLLSYSLILGKAGAEGNTEITGTLFLYLRRVYHFFKGGLGQKQDSFVVKNYLLLPKIVLINFLNAACQLKKAVSAAIILKLTSTM